MVKPARIYRASFGLEALSAVIKESATVTTYGFELLGYRVPTASQAAVKLALLEQQRDLAMRESNPNDRSQKVAMAEVDLSAARKSSTEWSDERPVTYVDMQDRSGIVDFSPDDQVVTVRAGTRIWDIQNELAAKGQTLPMPSTSTTSLQFASAPDSLTVGHAIEFNLPHGLESQCGSWRDWLLGAAVLRSDGSVARCGSRVVKNVAGYDIHKLLVGSRGTLMLSVEYVLRTYPLASLPASEAVRIRRREAADPESLWIHRVLRTDWETALAHEPQQILEQDPATCTLWAAVAPDLTRPRFPNDWVMRSGCGKANVAITHPDLIRAMQQTQLRLDPEDKFNPGEFGSMEVTR